VRKNKRTLAQADPGGPRIRRTKIVCTLGPSTYSAAAIRALMDEGMDVARINFSHGTRAQHAELVATVREQARNLDRPVAIMGDLQGPRIRIGELPADVEIAGGDDLIFAPERVARNDDIPVTYEALANDVHVGDRILVDDGLLELLVLDVLEPRVKVRVIHGGPLRSHKGMNLPGVDVSAPSMTEKDIADIAFAVEQGFDCLAMSFVRRAEDLLALRERVPPRLPLIAKIEKEVALRNIESIVQAADAIMVARGDLGVELPFEVVPTAQKSIIALCNRLSRPVITATQMLESMVEHPRPTRAEASDVANAILDGTDAVMLSAETATGAYPRLAVAAMKRIIREMETHPIPRLITQTAVDEPSGTVATEEAIAAATVAAARMLRAPLVIVFTKRGTSARIVASRRPSVPVLVLTDMDATYRQLALVWGVIPVLVAHRDTYNEMVKVALEVTRDRRLARAGDRVIVTAGVPFDVPGTTNSLKVEVV
jgi:pyruvate kinase